MLSIFKHDLPKPRGIYVILKGTLSGQFIVYIEEKNNNYIFLTLPDKNILEVPIDAFKRGIKNSILEYIEKLPRPVYCIVEKEFFNINKGNGLRRPKENNKPDKRSASRT